MCLSNPIPVYKDGQDIKVYKVVEVLRGYDTEYRSPYNPFAENSCWKLGITNVLENDNPWFLKKHDGTMSIGIGAFHSFLRLEDAVAELRNWEKCASPLLNDEYTVLECVIPANTKFAFFGWYYTDDFNSVPAYASQSLTPVNVFTREELKAV